MAGTFIAVNMLHTCSKFRVGKCWPGLGIADSPVIVQALGRRESELYSVDRTSSRST